MRDLLNIASCNEPSLTRRFLQQSGVGSEASADATMLKNSESDVTILRNPLELEQESMYYLLMTIFKSRLDLTKLNCNFYLHLSDYFFLFFVVLHLFRTLNLKIFTYYILYM